VLIIAKKYFKIYQNRIYANIPKLSANDGLIIPN